MSRGYCNKILAEAIAPWGQKTAAKTKKSVDNPVDKL